MRQKKNCSFSLLVVFLLSLLFLDFSKDLLAGAESTDPAQEFLLAYQSFQQAERLERAGKRQEAITKYRYAESILRALSNKNPDWQQPVVDYRLHKVTDSLLRLTGSLSPEDHEESTAPYLAEESTHQKNESSGETKNREEEEKSNEAPSISITPPTQRKTLSQSQLTELEKQLKKTELELEKTRSDLNDKVTQLDHSRVVIVDMKSQLEQSQRQIADLKTDLSKTRLRSKEREASLQQSMHDLESKVDSLTADQEVILEENKELQNRLSQATTSLTSGLETKKHLEELQAEVDKEKNSIASLNQQLITAKEELKSSSELNDHLKKQLMFFCQCISFFQAL